MPPIDSLYSLLFNTKSINPSFGYMFESEKQNKKQHITENIALVLLIIASIFVMIMVYKQYKSKK